MGTRKGRERMKNKKEAILRFALLTHYHDHKSQSGTHPMPQASTATSTAAGLAVVADESH